MMAKTTHMRPNCGSIFLFDHNPYNYGVKNHNFMLQIYTSGANSKPYKLSCVHTDVLAHFYSPKTHSKDKFMLLCLIWETLSVLINSTMLCFVCSFIVTFTPIWGRSEWKHVSPWRQSEEYIQKRLLSLDCVFQGVEFLFVMMVAPLLLRVHNYVFSIEHDWPKWVYCGQCVYDLKTKRQNFMSPVLGLLLEQSDLNCMESI